MFGWNSAGEITFQTLVILLALFAAVLILIKSGVEIFISGWKAWGISITVILVGSTTGSLQAMANFLLRLESLFGLLEKWKLISVALTLIFIVVVFFFVNRFLGMMRDSNRIDDSRRAGQEIATERKIARVVARGQGI